MYCGLGGMLLPAEFLKPDRHGCRGGVEFGQRSTSTDREVALLGLGSCVACLFGYSLTPNNRTV